MMMITIKTAAKQLPLLPESMSKTLCAHRKDVFSFNEEGQSDICYNMDEPQRHDAKWNKPDLKGETIFDSLRAPKAVRVQRRR